MGSRAGGPRQKPASQGPQALLAHAVVLVGAAVVVVVIEVGLTAEVRHHCDVLAAHRSPARRVQRLPRGKERINLLVDDFRLVRKALHVDARRVALHPQAPMDERVHVNFLRVADVRQHFEEHLRVLNVEADGSQERRDLVIAQIGDELLPRDLAVPIGVHLHDKSPELRCDVALFPALFHRQRVAVSAGNLLRVLDEDTRQDVVDGKVKEGDVEQQKRSILSTHRREEPKQLDPIHAPGRGHKQRGHRDLHRTEVFHQLPDLIGPDVVLADVSGCTLYEDQAEQDEYEHKHHEAPEERHEGADDGVQHCPELAEESDHPEDPCDLHDAEAADEPKANASLGRPARQEQVGILVHGEAHDKNVEYVPSGVVVAEEVPAMYLQFQDELCHIKAQEPQLDVLVHPRLLRFPVGIAGADRTAGRHAQALVRTDDREHGVQQDDDPAQDFEGLALYDGGQAAFANGLLQ
mmetsp:Transcript_22813/g.65814  ORF Transcript_22813/g.65814 Transcript_22813/m.65814 type:complete len:465 (+) Transcript_22813:52-1446(+)